MDLIEALVDEVIGAFGGHKYIYYDSSGDGNRCCRAMVRLPRTYSAEISIYFYDSEIVVERSYDFFNDIIVEYMRADRLCDIIDVEKTYAVTHFD